MIIADRQCNARTARPNLVSQDLHLLVDHTTRARLEAATAEATEWAGPLLEVVDARSLSITFVLLFLLLSSLLGHHEWLTVYRPAPIQCWLARPEGFVPSSRYVSTKF